jgi:predicted extracellular nuclease
MPTTVLRLLPVLGLAACLTPKPSGDDTGGTGPEGAVTVYDLQQGRVEDGAMVSLDGLVVTTGFTLDGEGFFVQAPEGGPHSGVYVFLQGSFPDLFLSVGDEVSVSGQYVEYYDFSELTVTSPDGVRLTGRGEAVPQAVPADTADWEPWEGVLVSVEGVSVADCPNQYGEAALSAGGLVLDDGLFVYDAGRGDAFSAIVGAIAYNFETYRLWPRDAADFAGRTPGEGCVVSVRDIQEGGTLGGVELAGAVVTGGPTADGGYFVQDAGGGAWSGVYLFAREGVALPALTVGDVVDVRGSAVEYYDFTEVTVDSAEAVAATGATADVVAEVLAAPPADWEPYEGGLVTLQGVEITALADYGEVETSWDIHLDDWIADLAVTPGATFDAVTGLVAYSYGTYKIIPRGPDDFVGGTTPEPTDTTVAAVQQDGVTGRVRLTGVVAVNAVAAGDRDLFVQAPGGGAWSGVLVYLPAGSTLAVDAGDVLDVIGTVTEYYGLTEIVVADVAEVTPTGTTAEPFITALSAAPADWEPYEGVLVSVDGLATTGEADGYGAAPTNYAGLLIDDTFTDWAATGTAWGRAIGPVTYGFESFRLLPRDSADLQP